MRGLFVLALSTMLGGSIALAQNVAPKGDSTDNPAANARAGKSTTTIPDQSQPQGDPGRTNTTSGGAPANSPQGDTPAGMQPNPDDPKKDSVPKK